MKTIFITGGSTGIGAAVAKKFNQNNWRVIITSRNDKILNQTKNSIIDHSSNKEIYCIPCDISKRVEIHKAVKDIEKILHQLMLPY